jgi:hypothetical protein
LGLASNCSLPDLCLLSSQDYRREPLLPDTFRVCFGSEWIICPDFIPGVMAPLGLLHLLQICSSLYSGRDFCGYMRA